MEKTKKSIVTKKAALKPQNTFKCAFQAKSVNESFARVIASAFVSQLNPTVAELSDLKTAVSEAVTNCIVHGYRDMEKSKCSVTLEGEYYADGKVVITVRDKGCGIENIEQAIEPLYTTDSENERSGMGFTIMTSFTDKMRVTSAPGKGTTVRLEKYIILT